ncbi:hypothetical protein AcV7_002722 [Taiwanofungus camphoratus]|nr:hypothetical protein AcV7_002722 [Antrodia cinnamomea]
MLRPHRVLDSLHMALVTHSVYVSVITNFGDPQAAAIPSWTLKAHVLVTALSDVTVRGLICWRVWVLSEGNWILTAVDCLSTLVAFGGSCAFAVITFMKIDNLFNLSSISWILYMSFGSGVAADVLLTTSLCMLLRRCQNGCSSTSSIVRLLMLYTINTGALTSLCAISCLVTYATLPDNLIFMSLFFILPKLLFNSLLATLNARHGFQEIRSKSRPITMSTALISPPRPKRFTETSLCASANSRYSQASASPVLAAEIQTSFRNGLIPTYPENHLRSPLGPTLVSYRHEDFH